MSENFADRLLDAIEAKGSPICVGIDPIYEMLPDAIAGSPEKRDGNDHEAVIDAVFAFTTRVLQIVSPHVPCVKFQSAYFEQWQWDGVEAYFSLIGEASEQGLLVIGDVKRGDIGSTAAAYAMGHLVDPGHHSIGPSENLFMPDAITINPFCGLDTIAPFVKTARDFDKGLFVLVRTSNPGSGELQDAKLEDGRTWSEMLADRLKPIAAGDGLVGTKGYSAVGAVVGATQPQTMQSLRARLSQSMFLLPGYGAQGATAEMTRAAFVDGRGALVSASRSILYAHREKKYIDRFGSNWEKCVEAAVLEMKADVGGVLGKQ
jgi:orotidine-5'-phosphate decarboxylase